MTKIEVWTGTYENQGVPGYGHRLECDGTTATLTDWSEADETTDDPGYPILRTTTGCDLSDLATDVSRGSYSMDDPTEPLVTRESILNAMISYQAYHGGDETFVESVMAD